MNYTTEQYKITESGRRKTTVLIEKQNIDDKNPFQS
jgi:hypothetical protein